MCLICDLFIGTNQYEISEIWYFLSILNRSMPYNAFEKRHGREKVLARYDQVIISLLVFIHVNRVYTFRRFPVSCFNLFCYRYGIPSSTFDY